MFQSVLVVCVGNVCRSPVGERLLRSKLAAHGSDIAVASAGIGALEGHSADAMAAEVAASHGLLLEGHVAQQFTRDIGSHHDLILVMEPGHRQHIMRVAPDLSGRVMLFDHWANGGGIADPFRRSREFHEAVFNRLDAAATEWAAKLVRRAVS